MKKGDKIVCINADNQVNDFIHGYYKDGEEAGFDPDRFVKLNKNKI